LFCSINAPYQQLAFQLDAAQLQFYMGLSGAAVALQLIFWPAAYMVFGLNKMYPLFIFSNLTLFYPLS
jgi:hypothetical protein